MTIDLRSTRALTSALLLTTFLLAQSAATREPSGKGYDDSQAAFVSEYCLGTYDIGKIVFPITNFGMVGYGKGRVMPLDCFIGTRPPSGEYPRGTTTRYLYKGGLWVGGVVGRDTLVSTGTEFNTLAREFHPIVPMEKRSTIDPHSEEAREAVSELDFRAVYADTFTSGVALLGFDPIDARPHRPLGLRVEQKSYGWSYGHADDFAIWNYRVTNVSDKLIKDVYIGLYWDADVHEASGNLLFTPLEVGKGVTDGRDDLSGFIWDYKSPFEGCGAMDTLGLAWTADQDGDYKNGAFEVPDVTGIRILGPQVTNRELKFSYNWWVYNYNPAYDYGPQLRANPRDMGNGMGTPYGDRNKYHLLSNGEVDFDQAYVYRTGLTDFRWVRPSTRVAVRVSRGADVQQLLSVGPYDIVPGGVVDLPVAFVGGENLHSDANNYVLNIGESYNPDLYTDKLNFNHLVRNAIVANRVYDVPGLDTNDDGYRGKFRVCVLDSEFIDGEWVATAADTNFYEGDGIPDYRAAAPPPSPEFSLQPVRNGIRVRFNGTRSETSRDPFSNQPDFEGYRVYIARDNREQSYAVVAQYDRENYDKWVFTEQQVGDAAFTRLDDPMTLAELRCLYGSGSDPCADESFDPLRFGPGNAYIHPQYPDSVFYFTPHDYNQSEFGKGTPITKVYPEQPEPTSMINPRPDELTEEGLLKYYEYEIVIDDLLPSVPYHISVTAFDFGSPRAGLAPLESSLTLTSQSAYPDNAWDEKEDSLTNIYVYPNPYRHDEYYRRDGYEGRGRDNFSRDRVRQITFANIPHRCTISIYSLDGDLIRKLEHESDPSDPKAAYHEWDMITRNYQMVVSGMYYWVVESPDGQAQIGKLVILM